MKDRVQRLITFSQNIRQSPGSPCINLNTAQAYNNGNNNCCVNLYYL